MRFIKNIFLIALLIFFKLLGLVFKSSRKGVDLGVDAYKSVKNSENFEQAYKNFTTNQYAKARLSIPEEVIALMAKIAQSDGKISQLEIEFMSSTIKSMAHAMQQAGLPVAMIKMAKKKLFNLANQAKKDNNPASYYCYMLSQSGIQVRMGALLQLIAFATLDGLSNKTLKIVFEIGQLFRFNDKQIQEYINRVNGASQGSYASTHQNTDPYKVLACQKDNEFSDIKKAYRRLVKQNHPDFMHGQGMDHEKIQQATEKMQDINAAFAEIKRLRGL